MAAPLLFRTTNVTVDTASIVFTHGLGGASAGLQVIITPRSSTGAGYPHMTALTSQTVSVLGVTPGAGDTLDLTVIQFHSIQGGPT